MIEQICAVSAKNFVIKDEDLEFYKRLGMPIPTLCPEERQRRRWTWYNDKMLYNRKCDATSKSIISVHHPDNPYPVYDNRHWWSDDWEPLDYGQDYDFDTSFFEQYKKLYDRVPQIAVSNDNDVGSQNCAYCHDFAFGKNCYLVWGTWKIEDSMYCMNCFQSREMYDCYSCNVNNEMVYESLHSHQCYDCAFMYYCENCSECRFGYDLKSCRNCFGCVGLRQKQYYIYNKPYSKADYETKIREMNLGSRKQVEFIKSKFFEFRKKFPYRAMHLKNCEDCTGDDLFNCKNVEYGFDCSNSEYSKFIDRSDSPKHSYDVAQTGDNQWCYEGLVPDNSYNALVTNFCWKSKFIYYSDNCHSCEECFGCISLRRKRFCIFNKQYTETEYKNLKAKIIEHMKSTGEWGEFFPSRLSPFGYNESGAQEYYKLTKEEAFVRGFRWREVEPLTGNIKSKVPDDIETVDDNVLNEVLYCEVSGRPYKIQKAELAFYRKMCLPLPSKCPAVRYQERVAQKAPRTICQRLCDYCDQKISSVYGSDFEGKVLCEACYLNYMA